MTKRLNSFKFAQKGSVIVKLIWYDSDETELQLQGYYSAVI